jgi:hypothetical protein
MISHGLQNHPYFAIAQPPSFVIPEANAEGQCVVEIKDPKTGEVIKTEFIDIWRISVDELLPAKAFCKLVYGIDPDKLVKVLAKRFPEIEEKQTIHFLLLKKL